MRLRAVFRSFGGENTKFRPPYYSKLLTLLSFVRSASAVAGCDLIFVNDGPVPPSRLAVMERYGRVIQIAGQAQGMRASYRYSLELPDREGWGDDDVVSFNEDDYLYTAVAFAALAEAAHDLPEAAYLSLYGDEPHYADPDVRVRYSLPRGWAPAPDRVVDGRRWFNRPSVTSTFAARVGALRQDLPIFLACLGPFRRRFLDHETCLMYQGFVPYHGLELLSGLPEDLRVTPRGLARAVALLPYRVALNRLAARLDRSHRLYVLAPNQATHLEYPVISTDQDWLAVAADVADWAETEGLTDQASSVRHRLHAAAAVHGGADG